MPFRGLCIFTRIHQDGMWPCWSVFRCTSCSIWCQCVHGVRLRVFRYFERLGRMECKRPVPRLVLTQVCQSACGCCSTWTCPFWRRRRCNPPRCPSLLHYRGFFYELKSSCYCFFFFWKWRCLQHCWTCMKKKEKWEEHRPKVQMFNQKSDRALCAFPRDL